MQLELVSYQEQTKNWQEIQLENKRLEEENRDLYSTNKVLQTRLEERERQFYQQIENKENLKTEFQNMANHIFEQTSHRLIEQNKTSIVDNVVSPLKDDLSYFKNQVENYHHQDSKERNLLVEHLKQLAEMNRQLDQEAKNLTEALTQNTKFQGSFGELELRRILEVSGLTQGREYSLEVSLKGEDGRYYRPDVIVHLPEDRDVIIDAKVSLTNYKQYCASDNEQDRKQAFRKHLQSVRQHIHELAQKEYHKLSGLTTLDHVLMFIPVEPALNLVLQKNQEILQEGFKKNIILVNPSTLLLCLRLIESIWHQERQDENAREIIQKAEFLYERFVNFTESLLEIGQGLDKAKNSYEQAWGRLKSNSGKNLVDTVDSLRHMGIRPKKELNKLLKRS